MRENENNRRIFAGAAAIATIAALAMPGTAMAAMADTASATDACTPYSRSEGVCPTGALPSHYLDDEDIPDAYKGFTLSTEHYAWDKAEWDENWTGEHRRIPTGNGASVRLTKVGVWTDPQGVKHDIDATITVVDRHGGMAFSYGGMFGLFTGDNRTDYALSYGATWKVSFTYSDTGETVPASFKGMTGFGDLDGTVNNDAAGLAQNVREGVELLDGFDAAYTGKNSHLVRYGTNGWGGAKDNNKAQTDLSGDTIAPGDRATLRGETHLYAMWTRVAGTVAWTKTDAKTGDILSGSEWTLRRVADENGAAVSDAPITVADNGDADTDARGGVLTVDDLAWGDWLLTETKAPAGHDPLGRPVAFTIDQTHTTVNLGDVANNRTPAKVRYDANGGKGETKGYDGAIGDTPAAATNGFSKDCATFTGWNTKPDGSGVSVKEGAALPMLTGDATLYAQWSDDACPAPLASTGANTGVAALAALGAVGGAGLLIASRRRAAKAPADTKGSQE